MIWSLELVLGLLITPLWIHNLHKDLSLAQDCLCDDPALCRPLPRDDQVQVEVFAFHLEDVDWNKYDWSKITTVVVTGDIDLEIVCTAHANNARVVFKGCGQQVTDHMQNALIQVGCWAIAERSLTSIELTHSHLLNSWIKYTAGFIKVTYMDGIYLDVLEAVGKGSDPHHEIFQRVKEVASYLRQEVPGFQVSLSVPWSPNCKNEPCLDFLTISQACDILLVTSFDIPNNMRDGCVARSTAPYHHVLSGLLAYIRLGIESRKLVMVVAWFGYDYSCQRFLGASSCELEMTAQSIPCSYPAARQIPYKEIMQLLPSSLTGRFWDDDQKAPYFVYLDGKTYHEIWYDDPESVSMKSSILKKLKLRGIGVWAASDINYSGDARAVMQAEETWNALCPP